MRSRASTPPPAMATRRCSTWRRRCSAGWTRRRAGAARSPYRAGLALPLFRLLRHGKALRGTALDPFGWQHERRVERGLIAEYEADVRSALDRLRPDTLDAATKLAALPMDIRGFGPVKAASLAASRPRREALLAQLNAPMRAVAAE